MTPPNPREDGSLFRAQLWVQVGGGEGLWFLFLNFFYLCCVAGFWSSDFWDRISLCSSGCLRTSSVGHAGFEYTEIHLLTISCPFAGATVTLIGLWCDLDFPFSISRSFQSAPSTPIWVSVSSVEFGLNRFLQPLNNSEPLRKMFYFLGWGPSINCF